MKKLALLPLVFVLSLAVGAQEKYVEVLVSDTLLVEPQEWNLHLNIEKKYNYSSLGTEPSVIDSVSVDQPPPRVPSNPLEIEGTSVAQLSALVKKFGGKILGDSNSVTYNLVAKVNSYRHDTKGDLVASFGNRKSLEGFLKEAKRLDDVESQIIGTLNPKIQDFQIALEKKLMSAARVKAARLADLGGGKLGSLPLISEITESDSGWFKNFLETMIKFDVDRKNYALYMNPDKIKLERSLKVRFAIL